jgi:hypothetical protein
MNLTLKAWLHQRELLPWLQIRKYILDVLDAV